MKLQESILKLLQKYSPKRQDFVKRTFSSFHNDLLQRKLPEDLLKISILSFWSSAFKSRQVEYFNLITDVDDVSLTYQAIGYVMRNSDGFIKKDQTIEDFFNFVMNQNCLVRLVALHCLKNKEKKEGKEEELIKYTEILEKSVVGLEF
jgi:hypothetical protein